MTFNSKTLLLSVASGVLLTSSAAFADRAVKRIDHPNGAPTFAVEPCRKSATVAIYVNGQGVTESPGSKTIRKESRTVKLNTGRGQKIEVRNAVN